MEFTFEIIEVNKDFLIKYPCAALDGNLTIDINRSLLFDKEGVSLLELALHINSWLREVETERYLDFDYSADDYQENPVLHFTKINGQHYTISSAWVKNDTAITLEATEIVQCFNAFLQELNTTIQESYGVSFDDIPLFKLITKPKEIPTIKSNSFSLKGILKRLWSQ